MKLSELQCHVTTPYERDGEVMGVLGWLAPAECRTINRAAGRYDRTDSQLSAQ